MENFLRILRKIRLGFSHEETLLDGTAQSVRNVETPRDRSGRPVLDSEKKKASTIRYWKRCSRIGIVKRIKIIRESGECSTNLQKVSEQNEISNLETIGWENHSWKYLSLNGDERIMNLQRTKVYVFSDSLLCLGKIFEYPESNDAYEQRLG